MEAPPHGSRARAPLAAFGALGVQVQAVDHHNQVGAHGTALLQPADDRRPGIEEPDSGETGQIFSVFRPQAAAPGHEGDGGVDV